MSANRTLVADASGTWCRVPSPAMYSISNSPHGGSGAVPCTACNVLMKAVTNGRLSGSSGSPTKRGFAKSLAMITWTSPPLRGKDRRSGQQVTGLALRSKAKFKSITHMHHDDDRGRERCAPR